MILSIFVAFSENVNINGQIYNGNLANFEAFSEYINFKGVSVAETDCQWLKNWKASLKQVIGW